MAQITPADFVKKWAIRFADNTFQLIREKDFREFAQDIADVFGVKLAEVPAYKPGTTYQVGNLVRYTPQGGQEAFYYALNAGALSAPGPGNVTDWKVVPGPVSATALWQSITLLAAQGIDGAGVQAGRLYQIDFGVDGQGRTQYVYLMGLDQYFDTTRGVLEVDGTRTAIEKIDLGAGTWTIAGQAMVYTDTQARAAQLNRTPPPGTTTVTLIAEAATDYATAASGTFTVDATGCVVGKVVRFSLSASATQPVFANAPTGQPFDYVGATYITGRAFDYSLLVCADKIQVVILAR